MSTENIAVFFEKIQSNEELQAKVTSIPRTSKNAVAEELAALSGEVGTPFSAAEFLAAMEYDGVVSDAELEQVAGGFRPLNMITGGSIFKDFPKLWKALWS